MTTNTFNYRLLRLITLLLICVGSFSVNAARYEFKPSSILSSGTWVKVRVPQTGIYEITYDELREMGFSDPSKVGVFGKGGTAMPISFTDGTTPIVTDDLTSVGAWHNDSKLYFYGRGTEVISLNSASTLFERKSRNIYSEEGAYFLSDSPEAEFIAPQEKPALRATSFPLGFDYVYHEKDLYQNITHTGQVFWGENLLEGAEVKESYRLPLKDPHANAYLDCRVYAADKSTGIMRYGATEATGGNRTFSVVHPSPAAGSNVNPEFMHMANPVLSLSLPSDSAEIYLSVDNPSGNFLNLDYWLLTYSKQCPDFSISPQPQERLAIVRKTARAGLFSLPADQNVEVFDVSDPAAVTLLSKEKSGDDCNYYFSASRQIHEFIFCNFDKPQLKVSGWEKVENTDIHALASQGADFLIITVPEYMDFADRLAGLHRQHDGMEVLVVLASQLYNEFSGGVPDPMAYRAMTKLTYEASGGRLKNVLLVGRMLGDFRKAALKEDGDQYLIAFQDMKVSAETDASMVMDFYGLTEDYLYNSLQNNTMQVGVGLLPFYSKTEAERYLRKVERYLTDDSKAAYLNEFLAVGGVGDNHTHDTQAGLLTDYWDTYVPDHQINTEMPLDAYGEAASKKNFFSSLNYGKLFSIYLGHGTAQGLNISYDFCKVHDLSALKNTRRGFMMICACDLSDTDHLRKGFGEAIVTDTEYGMMGCIMAIRTSWSGQNFELAKLLSSAFYASPEKCYDSENPAVQRTKYRDSSPTIGEVYARAKSLSNYSNSLTYNYIGDPALVVPVALRRMAASSSKSRVARGEIIALKGNVWVNDTIHLRDTLPISSYSLPTDEGFNGKLVAKILSPAKRMLSQDYLTDTKSSGKELYFNAQGERLAEFNGTVKNGEYEINITVPEDMALYGEEKVWVLLSAYDHGRKLGAAGFIEFSLADSAPSSALDTAPPSIAMDYNPHFGRVEISIADNLGLSPACAEIYVDGKAAKSVLLSADEDYRNISLGVAADRLEDGEHTLTVRAGDQAGNIADASFDFFKRDAEPTLTLIVDRKAVVDAVGFSIENAADSAFRIVISDNDGNEVFRDTFTGRSFLWDCVASSGARVRSGLYRAAVFSAEDNAADRFSELVNFAVIE